MPPPLDALRAQLAALELQKTRFASQLLSLRSTHALSSSTSAPPAPVTSPAPSTPPLPPSSPPDLEKLTDHEILAHAFTRSKTLSKHRLESLYRMSGITTFTIRNPSPTTTTTTTEDKKYIGIRIDVFTPHQRRFQKPYYLILSLSPNRKSPAEAKQFYFSVSRHSIPAFIQLPDLARRFLPRTCVRLQRLDALVRVLRNRLVLYHRRVWAAERIKKLALDAGRVGDVTEGWVNRVEGVEWDLGVEVLRIEWRNGVEGLVWVGEKGVVGKVVVKDGKGRRDGEVEGRIAAGGLEGFAERMGWVGGADSEQSLSE